MGVGANLAFSGLRVTVNPTEHPVTTELLRDARPAEAVGLSLTR